MQTSGSWSPAAEQRCTRESITGGVLVLMLFPKELTIEVAVTLVWMGTQDASAEPFFSNRGFDLLLGRTILGHPTTRILMFSCQTKGKSVWGQTKHSKTFHLMQNKTFPNMQQKC